MELNCSNNPLRTLRLYSDVFYLHICTRNTYFHTIVASGQGQEQGQEQGQRQGYYGITRNDATVQRLNIWNRFLELYFARRLKDRFISWMWKSREAKIRALCDPKHLNAYIRTIPDEDVDTLDSFLNTFGVYK